MLRLWSTSEMCLINLRLLFGFSSVFRSPPLFDDEMQLHWIFGVGSTVGDENDDRNENERKKKNEEKKKRKNKSVKTRVLCASSSSGSNSNSGSK